MKELYRGAESVIFQDIWEGKDVIIKDRVKKSYRIKQIDERLRKSRTRSEVKLLTEVRKLGISVPQIFHVDEGNYRIIMEYIKGARLKEYLNSSKQNKIKPLCIQLGEIIGKLHFNNIVHGDLTTSNMIFNDGRIYLIDLSLGEFTNRIEDKGVDLKLLKEALKSTHFKIFEDAWKNILTGYKKEYKSADLVLKQLGEIEKRARYMNRD